MATIGAKAAENCDEFGWQPEGSADPGLVAETAQGSTHGYGRAWSRSSAYSLRPDQRSVYLVHTVEGGFDFTIDGVTVHAEPGQMVVFEGDADVTAQTTTDTARYVWFLPGARLAPGWSLRPPHEPITLTNAPMQGLISMTNSLLNSADRMSLFAFEQVGWAMEGLVLAAFSDGIRVTDEDAMHRDGLFTVAQAIIRSRFRDPMFGVAELASDLSTSRAYVHRSFMSMGTTPRREIERYRLADVERQRLLVPPLSELVESAGFNSMRQYRMAQARHRGRREVTEE